MNEKIFNLIVVLKLFLISTGLLAQTTEIEKMINIFPNPIQYRSIFSFEAKSDGFTQINVYSIDGKMIISTSEYLHVGKNSFSLSLPKGVYILNSRGINHLNSVKIISNASEEIKPNLIYTGLESNNPISYLNGIKRVTTVASIPTVTTMSVVSLGPMFIVSGGIITNDGGSAISERGICWNTTPNPTINNNKTSSGSGIGSFYCGTSSNLLSLTTYYIRAYAKNNTGTAYGNEICVMTINGSSTFGCPSVNSVQLMNYGTSTATLIGNVISQGGPPVTERGVCWSKHPNTTLADSKNISGYGLGSYYATAFNFTENSTYYIRAYATNQIATTYGDEFSFYIPGGKIGDSYDGGIIAYFYEPGENGFEADSRCGIMVSPSSIGSTTWTINSNIAVGSNRTGLGTQGLENTFQIVNFQGVGNYAAYLCNSLGWYLPTKDELNKIYSNRVSIGGFNNAKYWTSSEGNASNNAFCQDFGSGEQMYDIKSNTNYVRGAKKIRLNPCIPIVKTAEISSITSTHAIGGGNVLYYTGSAITSSGVCWSTHTNPTIADSHTDDGKKVGEFRSQMTGLTYPNIYYVRAYATNNLGTGYGDPQMIFTTVPTAAPTLNTNTATSVTAFSAISGGNITNDGGAPVTERGICWSLSSSQSKDTWVKIPNSSENDSYSNILTGLSPGKTYYVCAYATNSEYFTGYGNVISFTTDIVLPTVSTTDATSIRLYSAVVGGKVTSDGGGTITNKGICYHKPTGDFNVDLDPSKWSLVTPYNSGGAESYEINLTYLSTNTTYFACAYAINSKGKAYANIVSIYTTAGIGDFYQGGIVGYVYYDQNKVSHGIIVATANPETGTWTEAKNMCSNLGANGKTYSDWSLPSIDDLVNIYRNKDVSKAFPSSYPYWSSSEASSTNGESKDEAWTLNSDGSTTKVNKESPFHKVYFLAIRYF